MHVRRLLLFVRGRTPHDSGADLRVGQRYGSDSCDAYMTPLHNTRSTACKKTRGQTATQNDCPSRKSLPLSCKQVSSRPDWFRPKGQRPPRSHETSSRLRQPTHIANQRKRRELSNRYGTVRTRLRSLERALSRTAACRDRRKHQSRVGKRSTRAPHRSALPGLSAGSLPK